MDKNLKEFINNEFTQLDDMIADTKKRLEILENAKMCYEITLKSLETVDDKVVQEKES